MPVAAESVVIVPCVVASPPVAAAALLGGVAMPFLPPERLVPGEDPRGSLELPAPVDLFRPMS